MRGADLAGGERQEGRREADTEQGNEQQHPAAGGQARGDASPTDAAARDARDGGGGERVALGRCGVGGGAGEEVGGAALEAVLDHLWLSLCDEQVYLWDHVLQISPEKFV